MQGPHPRRAVGPSESSAGDAVSALNSGSHADEPTRVSNEPVSPVAFERPQIEGYELLEEIHRGGQGVVFRAIQRGTKRQVALKVLLEGPYASETARRRFEREVELAASLDHPHIVTILDSGISYGRYYFAMEYIDGQRLDHYIQRQRLTIERVLDLFEQVASAVHYAHQRGVIHRDLKPGNILVDHAGQPRILDFGLAKTERGVDPFQTTVAVLSMTGQVVGTLAYMSPEQAGGQPNVDVRSDVYSLGVIFYEALVGQTPYPVTGPLADVLTRIAQDDPVSPRSVRGLSAYQRHLDEELETILLKALEKEPARRYQGAGELASDLRRYRSGEAIEAKRASAFYVLRKTLKRYRWQASAAGLFLLLLVGFLLTFAVLYQKERLARAEMERLRTIAGLRAERAAEAADAASTAQQREAAARREAETNAREARAAADELRTALVQQKLQRGELALARGDLGEARDALWDAYLDAPQSAAPRWGLRQFYQATGEFDAVQIGSDASLIRLSDDGRLALAAEPDGTLRLYDTVSGVPRWSLPAPGPLSVIDVDDSGNVAAAGPGWARVWPEDSIEPTHALDWSDDRTPISVHLHGSTLLLVDAQSVRTYLPRQPNPAAVARGSFESRPAPCLHRARGWLALALPSGPSVLALDEKGVLRALAAPTAENQPVRWMEFTAAGSLALLTDHLEIVDPLSEGAGSAAPLPEDAVRFALSDRDASVAWLSNAGEIVVRNADGSETRRPAPASGLHDMRFGRDGMLWTLERDGTLIRFATTPRGDAEQRIARAPVAKWVTSADGQVTLLVSSDGELLEYVSGRATALPVLLPNVLAWITGRDPDTVHLALDAGGSTAIVAQGNRIWYRDTPRGRWQALRWRGDPADTIRRVALSEDGGVLAVHTDSAAGDRQTLTLLSLNGRRTTPLCAPLELVGGVVRAMAFVPHSRDLLIARSDGAIAALHVENAKPGAALAPAVVCTLESPAYLLAFEQQGHLLAAACDDGMLRLASLPDGQLQRQQNLGRAVRSLAFNSGGDLLLVRWADGLAAALETRSLLRVMNWSAEGAPPQPGASWMESDSLLINDERGLLRIDYRDVDARIRDNRAAAMARRAAGWMADGRLEPAWAEGERLSQLDAARGRHTLEAVLARQLRRKNTITPRERVERVVEEASAATWIRLARAAYEGEHFETARELFERAINRGARLDAESAWRHAQCVYAIDTPAAALALLEKILARDDLPRGLQTRVELTTVAALVLADRPADARGRFERLERRRLSNSTGELAELLAARMSGNMLLGGDENQLGQLLSAVLKLVREQWLNYRDDVEFFAGEAARRRGDAAGARARYLRCIDLARDEWPVALARKRLAQLGPQ